jgi:phage terminase large subunit GpA-like protein
MLDGYQYMEPINRAKLARDKLQSYEKSLELSFQKHFEPRIYGEDHIRKRQAELYLHRMSPLTPTYLKQGVNFLSAHVFAKRTSRVTQSSRMGKCQSCRIC